MMNRLSNFIKKLTDNPQAKERFEICIACPKFNIVTDQCMVCGCFMTVKTFIPIFHCPENKW
jgi:hypothetical protein